MPANPLNSSQVHILQTLVQYPVGLTTAKLQEVCQDKASVSTNNIGPVNEETIEQGGSPTSLRALGYVSCTRHEGQEPTWQLTAKGRAMAKRSSTRSRLDESQRIPKEILDKAVKKVHPYKTYGFEVYTSNDLQEVRIFCGESYIHVTDENLRDQMVTRRKLGAFADPQAKTKAGLTKLLSLLEEFGLMLTQESQAKFVGLCDEVGL